MKHRAPPLLIGISVLIIVIPILWGLVKDGSYWGIMAVAIIIGSVLFPDN